ncbi:sensor histidine kinase [Marinobacteraceae bacterium S3BR75-40.1]
MSPRSIRATLLIWLLPLAIAFVGVAWFVHGSLLERMSREFFEDRLQQESILIQRQVQANYPDIDMQLMQQAYSLDRFHHTFAVQVGERIWAADDSFARDLLDGTTRASNRLVTVDSLTGSYLAYRDHFSVSGRPAAVVVAEDFGALEAAQGQLHLWVGVVSAFLLVLLVALIILVVNLAVRPLQQLGRELQELRSGERTRLDESVPREFQGLVRQLNALLDTLDRRLEGSRRSIANLSHSVKTPVSALMQWLDDPDKPFDAPARQQMRARFEELRNQLEGEIRRSRLAGPQAGKSAAPQAQTRDMLWMLGRLYPDKQFEFEADFEDQAHWPVEEQDFNELIGNLADNAGKWARRAIAVRLLSDGQGLHIEVEDDGPGVPEEALDSLGTRGHRLDEQVHGHGLGLSIVRDIVQRYGGTIDFGPGALLGGLRVHIALPLQQ